MAITNENQILGAGNYSNMFFPNMLPAHQTLFGPGQSTNHHHQAALPMDVHVWRQSFHSNGLKELLSSSDPHGDRLFGYSFLTYHLRESGNIYIYIYIYEIYILAFYLVFIYSGILSGIYLRFILASYLASI